MAFKSVKIAESADFSISSDGKLTKTYHETWRCTDNVYHTTDDVVLSLGILPGTSFSGYAYATARKVGPKRLFHQNPVFTWDVEIEYSTDTPTAAEDPVARPVKRRVHTTEQQRNIFRDSSNQLILDAAGSPPDGGIPVNHHMPTVVWERNESAASFSMTSFVTLSGTLNSSSYAGCDPKTLLLVATAEETFEGQYHFWKCVYTMMYNDQGWQPQFVNAGLFQLTYTGSTPNGRVRIYDGKEPAQDPQPLYGASGAGPKGTVVPIANRPGDCNFITVAYNGLMDHSTLGLSLV